MVDARKPIRRLDGAELPASEQEVDETSIVESHSLEISLEDLGNAFADALRVDRVTLSRRPEAIDAEASHLVADDAVVTPAAILEAILFVGIRSGDAIRMDAVKQVLKDFSEEEIVSLIASLNDDYQRNGHAVRIVLEVDGYAMRLADGLDEIHKILATSAKETQLNQNAIDCLALVAYQPGVTKEAIELQWGQPAGQVLAVLVRKGLLRVEIEQVAAGFDEGQPSKRYFTTDRFLAILGADSLEDLPRGDEL